MDGMVSASSFMRFFFAAPPALGYKKMPRGYSPRRAVGL